MEKGISGAGEVVPVEGDVDESGGDVHPFDHLDLPADHLGKGDSSGGDSNEDDLSRPLVLLDDLVGQAGENALDPLAVQEDLHAGFFHGVRLVSRPVCRRREKKKCLSGVAERHSRDRQLFILC
jgi:hypothetical protein